MTKTIYDITKEQIEKHKGTIVKNVSDVDNYENYMELKSEEGYVVPVKFFVSDSSLKKGVHFIMDASAEKEIVDTFFKAMKVFVEEGMEIMVSQHHSWRTREYFDQQEKEFQQFLKEK